MGFPLKGSLPGISLGMLSSPHYVKFTSEQAILFFDLSKILHAFVIVVTAYIATVVVYFDIPVFLLKGDSLTGEHLILFQQDSLSVELIKVKFFLYTYILQGRVG